LRPEANAHKNLAVIGAGKCACISMVSLRNYGLWWAELPKGWFWQEAEYRLRDGGPGGVTFSHLPGKLPERNSTEEVTRATVTKGIKDPHC
jgi:hypothetical protein